MSTAEILSLISTISFVLAAILCVLAIFLWVYFKIPAVIGDLSGRTAKKSIARMRASNEKSGGQGYKPSSTNASRGKLTDTMHRAGKQSVEEKKHREEPRKQAPEEELMPETGLLVANRAEAVVGQQTALLEGTESTGLLLDEDNTSRLNEVYKAPARRTGGKKLTMLDEVMLIHTDEVIR